MAGPGPMRAALVALAIASASGASAAGKLLIVHKLADSIGIYDASSGRLETEIKVGSKPHEAALSADGRTAYVTDYGADTYTETQAGGNTITVIDLTARKVVDKIDLGRYHRPHGIERGASGLFYVTVDFPAALLAIDGAARKVLHAIELKAKLPHMVSVSRDEKTAWTADAGSESVTLIDLAARRAMGPIEVGGVPMGLASTHDEKRLYVATRTNDMVSLIDTAARRRASQTRVAGQPVRMALSPDERTLYVTLIATGEVAALDPVTLKERTRVTAGARAEGIRITLDGSSLYVSAQADNKVLRFALPGLKVVQTISTPAKPDPILLLPDAR